LTFFFFLFIIFFFLFFRGHIEIDLGFCLSLLRL
jgi:hypothetical protein